MKKIVSLFVACLIVATALAQNVPAKSSQSRKAQKKNAKKERINQLLKQEEEGELIFHKHSIFGVKLATDGYGLTYESGKFKTPRKAFLMQFEISEKKHPKEKKQAASANAFQVNSVVYGKLANFYQFKVGVAEQRIIGGKGNRNGVAVSAIYGGGLIFGLAKPYYVDVQDPANQTLRRTYPLIIDSNYFEIKAAGLGAGWSDSQVKLGAQAKAAMRFDYGRLNDGVTAIEVGLQGEYYGRKVPQMAYNKQKQFFFSAYVTLLLGKRK
ncbi:MAG: hypothetical protein EOO04_18490 [Chitinophagaceae bacterium]|nr:MAG: hypothetical protein EOO04_18490 [Chitinophagaceae bacterium]